METTSAALFISISLVVFGISYYYFTTRHKERMEIIERGLSPDYFKNQSKFLPMLLVLGFSSVGVALGLAAGLALGDLFPTQKFLAVGICIFMGLGLALITSYFALKNTPKKE
ncbi:DUF6249 domain-containing protein [Sphingobacterium athyrii]|uniref:DUF6249 domain-containing protein n=1 Tax=Sphingobacterium athyrii TaxID=2152717 RepID=A0A363NQE6_9SPHI|nr:DUF6249 domain-containing protein [Sphingobacterium athyrii]PUV23026.1 hypothetical protein DCO56_19110 [Sphingobacterium athyrii]